MNPDAAMTHYIDGDGREVVICRHGNQAMFDRLIRNKASDNDTPPAADAASESVHPGSKDAGS